MKIKYILISLISLTFFLGSCKQLEIIELTKIKTGEVTDIGLSTANITSTFIDVGTNVSEYGHCWSTNEFPEVNDLLQSNDGVPSKGRFTSSITNLNTNTIYYVRPYAIEGGVVVYGDQQKTFSTLIMPLSISSPSSISNWPMASKKSITWSEDITGNVTLELYKEGAYVKELFAGIAADDKLAEWFIPAQLDAGLDYSIKILSEDNSEVFNESESFTLLAQETGSVNDYDGNTYPTIKIGEQWWMAKNLLSTRYADGTSLVDGTGVGDITGDYVTKYFFNYADNSGIDENYGKLYSWASVMNNSITDGAQGICPNGWHVPTEQEWQTLESELGMTQDEIDGLMYRGSDEGGRLKATGLDYWLSPNAEATNETNFNAIPAGRRLASGVFNYQGSFVDYWTSTLDVSDSVWFHGPGYGSGRIYRQKGGRDFGYSVRCIKGEGATTEFTGELYLYGGATDAGWDASNSIFMKSTGTRIFQVYAHLTTDSEGIMLLGAQAGNVVWGMNPDIPGQLSYGTDKVAIPPPAEEGFYLIQVDLNNLSYALTKIDWGILGDALDGWVTDRDMTYFPPYTWLINTDFINGEFKIRANDDWTLNYGKGAIDGMLELSSNSNIPITAGRKSVTVIFHPTNGYTYSIEDATGTVTDFDNNTYNTVKIGAQWWMAENIKSIHYSDGTALLDGASAGDLTNDETSKYYFAPENNEANVGVYGRLYTRAAVLNGAASTDNNPSGIQGVCPSGWHVPSDSEWKDLEAFLGMQASEIDEFATRGVDEGGKLKEVGTVHWNTPNTGATDEMMFTALPASQRTADGSYINVGGNAFFWTCSFYRIMFSDSPRIGRFGHINSTGMSVRCVKD